MKLIDKNINELIVYNNKLRIDIDTVSVLIDSIKEFGFINPLIINKNNIILSGVARLEAAKLLKLEKVPCIVIDHLTEEQEKIYRLVDNKICEFTYWNYQELNKEIKSINRNLFNYDLTAESTDDINIDDFFEDIDKKQISLF